MQVKDFIMLGIQSSGISHEEEKVYEEILMSETYNELNYKLDTLLDRISNDMDTVRKSYEWGIPGSMANFTTLLNDGAHYCEGSEASDLIKEIIAAIVDTGLYTDSSIHKLSDLI